MKKNVQDFYWSKLDNAARLYALVSSISATNVFRFSVKMSEPIKPVLLQKAVEQALDDMPPFKVKLKTGLFWYYFEMNHAKPKVREEYTYPCSKISRYTNNGYLFNVTYYEKMIHLEVFHALGDGGGLMQFIKVILHHYLRLMYPDLVAPNLNILKESLSSQALQEDSFLSIPTKTKTNLVPKLDDAYKVEGIKMNYPELKVIHGIMPPKEVIKLAKEKQVTLSCYLSSLLIYSIYTQNQKFSKSSAPISICVPIDLRNQFESETIRNFFTNITLTVKVNPSMTFDDILAQVAKQLEEKNSIDLISSKINDNVSAQKNMFIRPVPLVIKNMVLRLIYRRADKGFTTTLSNLGRITMPEELLPFIEDFRVMISVTPHQPIRCAVSSLQDNFVFSFTSVMEDTDIQKFFFRYLQRQGVNVTISSNEEINYEILS
ncbi:MAG TPA: hypothetical protein DCY20_06370 [Firmicutes bacterium]|nr:hypothetical protein [Bacillota bacterium]